jgi:hypothetical protein
MRQRATDQHEVADDVGREQAEQRNKSGTVST